LIYAAGTVETGVASGNAGTGLADFGTRLKAVFSNIPSGVHLWVSTTNLATGSGNTYAVINAVGLETASASIAGLVANSSTSELTVDPAGGPVFITGTGTGSDGGNAYDVTSTGEAVWEITNTKGASIDTLVFSIYVSYTAAPVTGAAGTVATPTVVLSYGPTAALPTGQLYPPIPYFSILNTTANTAFNITSCRTILLFPFVTSYAPYDTGLAISNTSTDPLGTTPQSGSCSLNFYPAPTKQLISSLTIPSGTTGVTAVSAAAGSGYTGYMIAVCSFQYAHGFGYLAETGLSNQGSMGFLALVIPDPGPGTRGLTNPIGVNEHLDQ